MDDNVYLLWVTISNYIVTGLYQKINKDPHCVIANAMPG